MIKYLYEVLSILAGVLIIVLSLMVVAETDYAFITPLMNVAGGLIAVVPPILLFYTKYRSAKEIEEQFLIFIRDLTESINSGMTLPIALKNLGKRDYGSLTPYVSAVAAQVDWGIPFQDALKALADKIKQVPIKRAITTIVETYRIGGRLSDTLSAVGESLITINRIKKERSASVHSQIVTSYMIFFVFVFILVILQIFLIPALVPPEIPGVTGGGFAGAVGTVGTPIQPQLYTGSFINFIIVQGFFAGLVTGKMAEGSVLAGLKHSVLLIALGYAIFSFSSQFPISLF